MSETNYTEIDFDSVGAKLRGRLYRSSNAKASLVVMAHGFTATAHMSLYKFAERLAEHGNHTLVYDHHAVSSKHAHNNWTRLSGRSVGHVTHWLGDTTSIMDMAQF